MNKWQTTTDLYLNKTTFDLLSPYCSEFLVHACDVEGLMQGIGRKSIILMWIDSELVKQLGEWVNIPCTYAGGANKLSDLEQVKKLSNGKVDLTFGSALDLFGGKYVAFMDCVHWNQQ
jgi:phosphoribosylformimino-5-aminoimidazole carboxamide ribotide isomerase